MDKEILAISESHLNESICANCENMYYGRCDKTNTFVNYLNSCNDFHERFYDKEESAYNETFVGERCNKCFFQYAVSHFKAIYYCGAIKTFLPNLSLRHCEHYKDEFYYSQHQICRECVNFNSMGFSCRHKEKAEPYDGCSWFERKK